MLGGTNLGTDNKKRERAPGTLTLRVWVEEERCSEDWSNKVRENVLPWKAKGRKYFEKKRQIS